jgi:hypothetical protein
VKLLPFRIVNALAVVLVIQDGKMNDGCCYIEGFVELGAKMYVM